MCEQCPWKGREVVGNRCQETGDRTGRATTTWMGKPSLSRSPPATAVHSFPTTSLPPAGPSARPSPAPNSGEDWGASLSLSKRPCFQRALSSFRFFFSLWAVGRGGLFLPPALHCLKVPCIFIKSGSLFSPLLFCLLFWVVMVKFKDNEMHPFAQSYIFIFLFFILPWFREKRWRKVVWKEPRALTFGFCIWIWKMFCENELKSSGYSEDMYRQKNNHIIILSKPNIFRIFGWWCNNYNYRHVLLL